MNDEQWVAEALHKKMCTRNHTDNCDWYYRDWKHLGSNRKLYIKKAKKVLTAYKAATVIRVMRECDAILMMAKEESTDKKEQVKSDIYPKEYYSKTWDFSGE